MNSSPHEQTSERATAPDVRRKGTFVGSSSVDDAILADSAPNSDTPSKTIKNARRNKRRGTRLLVVCGLLATMTAIVIWVAQGTTRGPAFYQAALDQPPEQAYAQGEAFEQSLAQWHNELHANGGWQLVLDDEQLNGWLGAHLPEKFPGSLPADISNPRCSITEAESRLAFQFHWKKWTFVVAATVEFFLTEEPNVLGARLKGVRSGVVPLPISEWMGSAANSAAGAGVKIRWTQDQGSPLALITIPDTVPGDDDLMLVLTGVEQRQGQLVLTGITEKRPTDVAPNDDTSPVEE